MIRGFESSAPLEPETKSIQYGPAIGAGIIAGALFLIVPRGSPWSALTFFSPTVLGRSLASSSNLPIPAVWIIHLLVSVIYALVISRIVAGLTQQRAILTGGAIGFLLYLLNLAVVSFLWPEIRGNEIGVAFTHIVFGLVAAGAYRGLLRRKGSSLNSASTPHA
jgi:hypothetical protein